MRVREHFLLGTEKVTISVTAKDDDARIQLFETAIETILVRYQEEFGAKQCKDLLSRIAALDVAAPNWRLSPDQSCWNETQRLGER